jgi:hypothetical protein
MQRPWCKRNQITANKAPSSEKEQMKQSKFPPGWDEKRVKEILAHYESQTEEEAVAEDEAAFEAAGQTVMEIPTELVPKVRELIAKHKVA